MYSVTCHRGSWEIVTDISDEFSAFFFMVVKFKPKY